MRREISELKANEQNPRTITTQKAAALRKSLLAFGDLGGVVFNRARRRLVGGHQRIEAFKAQGSPAASIVKSYDKPTRTGTVAEGYVDIDGERFSYREVDWPDESFERAANLAANKQAGDWSMPQVDAWISQLRENHFDLSLTMFDETDIDLLSPPRGSDNEWGEALDKVPQGEQGGLKTATFTLSAAQHDLVMRRLAEMKKLGPFEDADNDNSNGNALARLAELYHG